MTKLLSSRIAWLCLLVLLFALFVGALITQHYGNHGRDVDQRVGHANKGLVDEVEKWRRIEQQEAATKPATKEAR